MTLDVEKFLIDLTEQRERYRKMIDMTEEQNRAIESSDMDSLLLLLKQKNTLLLEIDEIERRSSPHRKVWNEERESLDPGIVGRVENAVGETKTILQKLLELEDKGRSMMEKRRGSTGDKIKEIQSKKRIKDAYGKAGPGESRFFDQNK